MKANKWVGLVTYASPYMVPPGAGVEQDNLHSRIPGQLTVRNGMRVVAFSDHEPEEVPVITDFYPYVFGGSVRLVALDEDGSVHVLTTPDYGPESSWPLEPLLDPETGTIESSYTGRFYDSIGEAPA